jgi:uncharacterized FlgJ-related protein
LATGLVAVALGEDIRPVKRVEFTSYQDLEPLMKELNYTPESWRAGVRMVPRLYLTHIAPRWRDRVSKEVSVQVKKRIFFRALAPLALRANELIQEDRTRAQRVIDALRAGRTVEESERQWFGELAVRYKVIDDVKAKVEPSAMDELLVRVDEVPLSLVLSQAAEESGWGTSRFAAEGNALFGQWSWSGKGITPENQRSGMGDYRIASFETPLASVMAYMQNLNTHAAYASLRTLRAKIRTDGDRLSGWRLAETLDHYSERGTAYVDSLHGIMRVNQLDPADDAKLGDGPTIYLIPVGDGS